MLCHYLMVKYACAFAFQTDFFGCSRFSFSRFNFSGLESLSFASRHWPAQ